MVFWAGSVSESETDPAQVRIPPRSAAHPSIASGDASTPHFSSNAAVEIANLGRVAQRWPRITPRISPRILGQHVEEHVGVDERPERHVIRPS